MAIIEHDWVWETATVSGTGSVTLPGTPAQTGARTFVSVYANNDQCPYVIADNTTGASESGIGTITVSGTVATLARTVVIESTNSNNLVDFAGNACGVFVTKAPGVQTSAGAADAGKVPILGSNGVLDSSLVPASGVPTPGIISGNWYGLPAGQATVAPGPDAGYIDFALLDLLDLANVYSNIGVTCATAPSAATTLRLGLYTSVNGAPASLIFDAGNISITATGTNSLSLSGCPAISGPIWGAIGCTTTNGISLNGYSQYNTTGLVKLLGAVSPLSNSDNLVGWLQSGYTGGALPASISPSSLSARTRSAIVALAVQA